VAATTISATHIAGLWHQPSASFSQLAAAARWMRMSCNLKQRQCVPSRG